MRQTSPAQERVASKRRGRKKIPAPNNGFNVGEMEMFPADRF